MLAIMKSYMKIFPIVFIALILAGCKAQTNLPGGSTMSNQPEDIAAINQLIADWGAGWRNGDPNTLLSLLSDEAVLIMSSEDPIVGKEAIGQLYQYVFENYSFSSDENYTRTTEVEQMKVEVDGDLGHIWSKYKNTETPKGGGETIEDHGNQVYIVKRQQDGCWKIDLMIANRSQPASENQ
jgi:uncharacterized protein (TIGR02246 family)